MPVLALSSWTWVVVAAFGLLAAGILIRATLVLIGRVKDLSRTFKESSAEVQGALATIREELDQAAQQLAAIQQRREGEPR